LDSNPQQCGTGHFKLTLTTRPWMPWIYEIENLTGKNDKEKKLETDGVIKTFLSYTIYTKYEN
jgi:hypothetical protein